MNQTEESIRAAGKRLDEALERRDIPSILSSLADDCEIRLLGVSLLGHDGARRWLDWLFAHVTSLRFEPKVILVQGDTLFEEFGLVGTLRDGREVRSEQSEVLIYNDNLVRSLRLYFDRLDFAKAVVHDPVSNLLVQKIVRMSLHGLRA